MLILILILILIPYPFLSLLGVFANPFPSLLVFIVLAHSAAPGLVQLEMLVIRTAALIVL
jgi:hypothetical protein